MLTGNIFRLECLPPPVGFDRSTEPDEWSAGCRVVLHWADNHWRRQPILTLEEREQLIEECKLNNLDHMFGDGMEEEYVMSGFPQFKGLLNMTDDELLQEYGHYTDEDDTPEKRAIALRREWEEE